MSFDLNQEPFESESPSSPSVALSPLLSDLEAVHEHIEERIRQLEAVTSRIRHRQMMRQGQRQTTPRPVNSSANFLPGERFKGNGRTSKRNGAHLIAKALGMEETSCENPGCYFDCNLCLDRAKDPILTCCGHLFCWLCFYQLSSSYLDIKECPVCNGEVSETNMIPIYGNGSDGLLDGHEAKLKDIGIYIPPRPHAKRVESTRQKLFTHVIPSLSVPITQTIQHMRRIMDDIDQRTQSQGNRITVANSSASPGRHNQPLVGNNLSRDNEDLSGGVVGNSVSRISTLHSQDVVSLASPTSGSTRMFEDSNVGREVNPEVSLTSRRRTNPLDAGNGANGVQTRSRRRRLR